jgi:hypothetical protein
VVGFPIRISTDQCLVDDSPWLFAVTHVLHRFLAPRHPPLALISLKEIYKMLVLALQFSRCARHDVEAKADQTLEGPISECLPHVAAAEACPLRGGIMLGVEGNSLKTEEKTRSVERYTIKR